MERDRESTLACDMEQGETLYDHDVSVSLADEGLVDGRWLDWTSDGGSGAERRGERSTEGIPPSAIATAVEGGGR
ncbi:hypothetical protein CRUP_020262 [Coryphaenoides rupestris]|nr:hypothetical protein CRUP_020262 [Coryphaenoides rupestris]